VLLLGDRRGYAWDPSNGVIAPLGFYPALQSQLNAAAEPDAAQLDDGRVAVFRGTQVEIFTP
jgi:hypothetical protein